MARVSCLNYRETVWSDIFPGNYHTSTCFQPAVMATENALELGPEQRRRTVWRLDGGAGSVAHLQWLCARGYHFLAKGASNRRAEALARQVARWDPYTEQVWLGEVTASVVDGRPVHVWVKRRYHKDQYLHSYYVSTLSLPSKARYMAAYDARGGAEVEQFRNDKSGLSLEARRKHSLAGQKAYILLGDLAHNLLADFYWRVLNDSIFVDYGIKRIVRHLLTFPGSLHFVDGQLVRVELSQKQFGKELAMCLEKYCTGR